MSIATPSDWSRDSNGGEQTVKYNKEELLIQSLPWNTHIFQVKGELHGNLGKGKYLNLKKGMQHPSKNSCNTMVIDGWMGYKLCCAEQKKKKRIFKLHFSKAYCTKDIGTLANIFYIKFFKSVFRKRHAVAKHLNYF